MSRGKEGREGQQREMEWNLLKINVMGKEMGEWRLRLAMGNRGKTEKVEEIKKECDIFIREVCGGGKESSV
jgi:hypothetical protein